MTRPLRRRHLQIWIAFAIALPVLFFAALTAREDPAPVNSSFAWEEVR